MRYASRLVSVLCALCAFIPGTFLCAASAIEIPFLPEEHGAVRPASAYQIELLNPFPAGDPKTGSKLALAWSSEGLRVWADVQDSTQVEADTAESLWLGDSIELFVSSPAGSKEFVQLLCAPGRTPDHSTPRWHYIDRQKEKAVLKDPVIQVAHGENSYAMEILFPWSNLTHPPAEGEIVGVQLFINNAVSLDSKRRLIWFPRENYQSNPEACYPVRLARKASSPQPFVASLEIEKLSRVVLRVTATADSAGKEILVSTGDAAKSATSVGKLEKGPDGFCTAILPLPETLALPPAGNLEVRVGDATVPPLVIPDLQAARLKALRSTPVVASPSIFASRFLPSVGFLHPELSDAAFGPVEFRVRYFNEAREEVRAASQPGRYGALVDIRTADGLSDRRRLTLFRTKEPFSPRRDRYEAAVRFPDAFGLSPDIASQAKDMISDFMNGQLHGLARTNDDWAVLAAGLHDVAVHPETLGGLEMGEISREWWYALEKQRGEIKPYEHLLYLPKDYATDTTKTWPVLLFLHGSGERGTDIAKLKTMGPPKLIESGHDLPFIVIAPQCPLREWWSAGRLNDLVEKIAAEHRVDRKRLYVTGLSMGGFGTWNLAARYPEKFAAIAPICGGVTPASAARLKPVPIWAFHGGMDEVVPVDSSEKIVTAIKQLGGDATLTIYPGVGHNSWTQTYDNPELYEWLLRHSL